MIHSVRRLALNTIRTPVATRNLSGEARLNNGFRDKSFTEAWAGDKGAWPVMGVIAFAAVFAVGWGVNYMATNPDARIAKGNRLTIFRGVMREKEQSGAC